MQRTETLNSSVKQRAGKLNRKDGIHLLLLATPFVLFTLAFSYVPLFGWIYAFFDYKPGIPLQQTPFWDWKISATCSMIRGWDPYWPIRWH